MYDSYSKQGDKIVVNDDIIGLIEKENHDRIEEELILENEIEVLKEEIFKRNEIQTCKLENISKYKRVLKFTLYSILFLILIYSLTCPNIPVDSFFPWVDSLMDLVITIDAAILAVSLPFVNQVCNYFYEKKEEETIEYETAIRVLNNELSKKEKELKEILDNKRGVARLDDKIHTLNTTSYYENIRNKLLSMKEHLSTIKEYQEEFNELGENKPIEIDYLTEEENAIVFKYIMKDRK